jgi:hypothetical protein
MTGLRRPLWWAGMSILLVGCGAATSQDGSHSTPATSAHSTPTTAANAANDFSCATQSGGDASLAAQLTDVRTAQFDGYDELTFQYVAPVSGGALHGVPAFTVTAHPSTQFTKDASGQTLTLDGAAGLLIVAHNASGWDTLAPTLQQTYTGSLDMHTSLTAIREVAEVGDFERTLSWGVGMSSAACFSVHAMMDPSRLVVDVQR